MDYFNYYPKDIGNATVTYEDSFAPLYYDNVKYIYLDSCKVDKMLFYASNVLVGTRTFTYSLSEPSTVLSVSFIPVTDAVYVRKYLCNLKPHTYTTTVFANDASGKLIAENFYYESNFVGKNTYEYNTNGRVSTITYSE